MTSTTPRVYELNLYRRYFDLVAAGRKSVEVRVRHPRLRDMAVGDVIRFHTEGTDETCSVRVLRVAAYPDFEALLDGEGPAGKRGGIGGNEAPRGSLLAGGERGVRDGTDSPAGPVGASSPGRCRSWRARPARSWSGRRTAAC